MREALTGSARVGLRRWTDGNFLTLAGPPAGRLAMVELHHDGTVVYAVDVSSLAYRAKVPVGLQVPVEVQVVRNGICDAVALAHEAARTRNLNSSSDLLATIVRDNDWHREGVKQRFPGLIAVLEQRRGVFDVPKDGRCPVAVRQTPYELVPRAGIADLHAAAHSLASGLINQFGIEPHLI